MRYLKQSTSVDVGIGPFLDETDGKTAETALTITQPDIRLKKNGGAWAQKAAAQTLSHEEAGWYELTLDTTDTDTIGHLLVAIHESGALPVWQEFHVLAANVYDSLFGAATDKLDVNVEEWNTTAVPAEHTAGYPIVTIKDGTGTGEIDTASGAVLATLANTAHGGTSATLRLGGSSSTAALYVTNSGGSAVEFSSSGSNGHALLGTGNGTGDGAHFVGGATGTGIHGEGGATSGLGFLADSKGGNTAGGEFRGQGSGPGLLATAGATGHGIRVIGGGTSGDGINVTVTSGDGLDVSSVAVSGTTTLSGAVSLGSTLGVTGTTTLAALTTTGTVTMNALTVSNATTLSGAVSLGSTLGVTGTATFAAITTTGTVTLNALTVSNATTLSGAVSLGSTLGVTGTATFAAIAATTITTSGLVTFNAFTVTNALTAGTNAIPWNASWDADVQSEVQDAIEVNHLDHLIAVADPGAIVANSSLWAALTSKSATPAYSSYVNTTDSLEAQRDNIGTVGAALVLGSGALVNVTAWTVAITGNITGNLSGSVGSVTGNVGGNVVGTVASVVTIDEDSTTLDLDATIRAAVGMSSANLDTQLAAIAADLPGRITKNTALSAFPFFMVDATDGYTAETGLTITATRSIDGGAFGACANSATEIGSGWYKIDLAAGDVNGNTIILRFTGTGARDRFITIVTQVT